MQVENYKQFGGQLPKLAALRHVAGFHRVIGRQTSAVPTEAMLLGVSGGIGATYALVEGPGGQVAPRLDLGPRYKGRPGEAIQALSVRLGLPASFRHTSSPGVAGRNALHALQQGDPVLVFASAAHLPHLAWTGAGDPVHVAVLYGVEGDGPDALALLADFTPRPVVLPAGELLAARGAIPELKHLSVCVTAPAAPVDLPKAIEGGLRATTDRMIDPPHPKPTFGLHALTRLAETVASTSDPEGWPRLFAAGAPLYRALLALFSAIELGEAGPGGGRSLFASFLNEAGAVLQGPDLGEAVEQYEALASAWQELAEAALPDSAPPLAEIRRLLTTRLALLRRKGVDAKAELDAIRDRIREIEAEIAEDFPLPEAARRALLTEIRERLLTLVADEDAAIRALRLLAR